MSEEYSMQHTGQQLDQAIQDSMYFEDRLDVLDEKVDLLNEITFTEELDDWILDHFYPYPNPITNPIDLDNPSISQASDGKYYCQVIDCSENDLFTVTGTSRAETTRVYCWCDNDGYVVPIYNGNDYLSLDNTILKCPPGATKLVVNIKSNYEYRVLKGIYEGYLVNSIKEAQSVHDDLINDIYGYVNYGYDTPQYVKGNSSSSSTTTKITVYRNNSLILLNGTTTRNECLIKINNWIEKFAAAASACNASNPITLTGGHKYKLIVNKISGSYVVTNLNYLSPSVRTYKFGNSSRVDTATVTDTGFISEFTVQETAQYQLCLYFHSSTTATNCLLQVLLQDLTTGTLLWGLPEGTILN